MSTLNIPSGGRDNQIRRTARILEIIQQIATRPSLWNRKKLADYYEISERMITKDLELIRVRLGLRVDFDGNGYVFSRLPHLPTTTYSLSEAISLLTAARLAQAVPGVNSTELAVAIARLESIFPDELQPLLREATEQLPRYANKTHRQAMLSLFHRALMEQKQTRILYATGSREGRISERIVEPYHLMPYGRSWHLIAHDHKRNAVLQFKLDRVQEAEILDNFYAIPIQFDLDEYLGTGWGLMRGSATDPEDVVLIFEPEAGRWVAEERWHSSQENEILNDDRIQIMFHVGITPEMISWLLYYGGNVRVERPLWLRKKVRQAHERGMKKNDG